MDPQRLCATVESARNGDAQAYQALLDAYGRRLYGYFFRATASHHDAEDLLGELMLRLVRTLKTYDDRGRFDQWLFRIAANMVRDRIRRGKTSGRATSLSAEDESGNTLAEQMEGPAAAVDEKLVAAEISQELHRAMSRLDDSTRQMILLRHFGELSYKEIAELYDCPLGTVLAKVHRGLRALRQYMGAKP